MNTETKEKILDPAPMVLQLTTTTRLQRKADEYVELVDTNSGVVFEKILKRDWGIIADFFAQISKSGARL